MPTTISHLAYSFRNAINSSTGKLKSTTAQELIASILGYKSLAAYQASRTESKTIEDGTYFIVDTDSLILRMQQLGIGEDIRYDQIIGAISSAIESSLKNTRVFICESTLAAYIQERLQVFIASNGQIAGHTSVTNSDGIREIYMPFEFSEDRVPEEGETLTIPLQGHISMEQDIEKPYVGHLVEISLLLTLKRPGRALILVEDIYIDHASLNSDWAAEVYDEAPSITFAHAIAEALDISIAEARELVDVDPQELTGQSGEMVYGYELDFTDIAPKSIAKLIVAKHGSLKIKVGPDFLENVSHGYD